MKLSSTDREKLEKIYVESVLQEDLTSGGLFGVTTEFGNELENGDNYAPEDNRIPHLLGRVQTRKGSIGKKKKRKKTKK